MYLKYTLDRFSMSHYTASTSTGKSPTAQTRIPGKQCSMYLCVIYYMQAVVPKQWFMNTLRHENIFWVGQGKCAMTDVFFVWSNITFNQNGKKIMTWLVLLCLYVSEQFYPPIYA